MDRDLLQKSFSFLFSIGPLLLGGYPPCVRGYHQLHFVLLSSLPQLFLLEKFFSSAVLIIPVPHGAPDAGADRLLISARVLPSADGTPELRS